MPSMKSTGNICCIHLLLRFLELLTQLRFSSIHDIFMFGSSRKKPNIPQADLAHAPAFIALSRPLVAQMDVSGVTNTGSNTIDIDNDNDVEIDDDPILGNNEEDEPEKTRSKAKNSSFVWDHFTRKPKPKVLPPGYKQKATCNYCGTEFGCNSDYNGTSSMRTHLVRRCKEYELSDAFVKKHGGDKRQKTLGEDVVSLVDHDNAIENVLEGDIVDGGSERGRDKGKGRGRELGTPTSEDWNVVQMYVEILRTFYIVTERLSSSLYVTCNTFYKEVTTIKNAIAKLELSDDPKLLLLAKGMHLKFDKEVESKVVEMKEGMKKIYNWYEKRTLEHEEAEASNVEISKNKEKNGKWSMDLSETLDSEFDQHMEEETNMMKDGAAKDMEGAAACWTVNNV
ncbi:hypothetical protein Vadar_001507 [Vaccinium darrowii]|uniref:Uncharacterized protein n=1 Tax=Vaccinium darrowii TaxID=229202 RepID=A0ACB7YIV6_9ERIC|nr:hypothetical protein Vadar_001507 [Vaccinium darrowii]